MNQELDQLTMIKILEELKEKRPVFCSEADFQFELAGTIRDYLKEKNYKNVQVLLEYYQLYESISHPIYIDILIIIDGYWYPIELKYKTKGNSNKNITLKYSDAGYEFGLKNHLAQNINCYKYLYDIKRIEEVKKNVPMFKKGYAIMLTNDGRYWEGPQTDDCIYSDFYIKENTVIPGNKELKWKENTSENIKKECGKKIRFDKKYTMTWRPYSTIPENKFRDYHGRDIKKVCEFQYIINEI